MPMDITFVHVPLLGYALLSHPLAFGFSWRQGKESLIQVIREYGAPSLEEILARESQRGIAKSLLLGVGGVGGAVGAGTTYASATAAAACAGGVCELPAVAAGGAAAGGAGGIAGLGAGAVLSILGWAAPAAYLFGLAYKRLGARHVIRRLHERIAEATTHVHDTTHLDEIIQERKITTELLVYHATVREMGIMRRTKDRIVPDDELAAGREQLARSFDALARVSRQTYHPFGDVMAKSYIYAKKLFERRVFKVKPYLFFS